MKIVTKLNRAISSIVAYLAPYSIEVCIGDVIAKHHAWSYSEALAWVRRYPASAGIILVYSRNQRLVGMRETTSLFSDAQVTISSVYDIR